MKVRGQVKIVLMFCPVFDKMPTLGYEPAMQTEDQCGILHTVDDPANLTEFHRIISGYLAFSPDTMDQLDRLLAKEDIPQAICFKGYLLKMAGSPRFTPAVRKCLNRLRLLTLNKRELAHMDVLRTWMEHRHVDALNRLEEIIDQYPRDFLALRTVHYLHFYTGNARALLDSVSQRLQYWDESDPYYGHLLGMQGFGLEESAEYREAEIVGRRACELNPEDIWAGHAMTHVFHMQGRWVDGIQWMQDMMPHWRSCNNFKFHLYWHKALMHLGKTDYEPALAVYDDYLAGALGDDFYLDACNAASLLWRFEMAGIATGDRWQRLYEISVSRVEDDDLVFSTLHYLMAPAMLQDKPTVDKALEHFSKWSTRSTTQGEVCNKVGLKLARAIVALARGDASGAMTLAEVRQDVRLIGGSWAQRELFKDLQAYYQEAGTS